MAVFKTELNWSTYQDQQLKTLKSLEQSFQSSVNISKSIQSNLHGANSFISHADKALTTMTVLLDRIDQSMTAITKDLVSTFTTTTRDFDTIVRETGVHIQEHSLVLETAFNDAAEAAKENADANRDSADSHERNKLSLNKFGIEVDSVMYKLAAWGKKAGEFSELSNYLIKISGATGNAVSDIRSSIVQDITSELNASTGGALTNHFNSQEVYKQMISIANGAGIGDLDVLEEITRPIMLANESMDVNIMELSKLLGRWNSRYNFSSLAMEDLVDEIRGNTAGNMASAEKTVQNLATLDNMIAIYSGGDEAAMKEMAESISAGTARLESMGIDTSRYTEYLKDIATGDFNTNPMLLAVLEAAGYSNIDASSLFANGRIDELYEALYQGESTLADRLGINQDTVDAMRRGEATNVWSQSASAYGSSVYDLLDVVAANLGGNMGTLQEFEESVEDAATAAESIQEKWVSLSESANNWLSKIYEKLADVQEFTHVSLADIAGLYVIGKGLHGVLSGSGLLGKIGSAIGVGGTAAGGGGVSSILAGLGNLSGALLPALAVGGVIGLLGAGVKSINEATDVIADIQKQTYTNEYGSDSFVNSIDSNSQVVYRKNITEDEKGNPVTEWSKAVISKDEYDANKAMYDALAQEYLTNTLKDDGVKTNFWSKIGDAIITSGAIRANTAGVANDEMSGIASQGYLNYEYSQIKSGDSQLTDLVNNLTDKDRATWQAYVSAGSSLVKDQNSTIKFLKNIKTYSNKYAQGKVMIGGNWEDIYNVSAFGTTGYATGTDYIDHDQIAYLHEGESVVPKKYNPSANMNELELLRKQSKLADEESKRADKESQKYIKDTLSAIQDIKSFLSEWKLSNDKSSQIERNQNKFSTQLAWLANNGR